MEGLSYSGNAIEIRNRIMFDFYLGLPHILKCKHNLRLRLPHAHTIMCLTLRK